MLGHFQRRRITAKRRLRKSDVDRITIASDFFPDHNERLWTDLWYTSLQSWMRPERFE